MPPGSFRIEKDSLGEVRVPRNAYWGAQTQRAVENFAISGILFPPRFVHNLGLIKLTAARTNLKLKLLNRKRAQAVIRAAREVMAGTFDDQFVVDIFQTGSGTSTNMNANEVIANRANEILGGKRGAYKPVHPNDHVNLGQSSNDVIPSCIHLSALEALRHELIPALKKLKRSLAAKEKQFHHIIKVGRTHLQDAAPIRLGQEFGGYAAMIQQSIRRLKNAEGGLLELAIGGTAVGTGINSHRMFARRTIAQINTLTGLRCREAANHFEAQGAKDALVETSGALKTVAIGLTKIANDIRWLGSGPRCGLGELILPEVQPGSSIMPGKVNPVIPEAVSMVAAQVIGNDAAVTAGGMSSNFELNVMMPVMAYNVLESIRLLSNAAGVFREKCIRGLKADQKRIESMAAKNLALATALAPVIGYDAAAAIARKAHRTGKTIREIALEEKVLPERELDEVLDPSSMVDPK
jgi:fumarate hydratase class II